MSTRPCRMRPWSVLLVLAMGCAGAGLSARVAAAAAPGYKPGEELEITFPKDPFAGMTDRFRRMARRDDKTRDWHRALMRWEAVSGLKSGDREARRRIAGIKALLRKNAAKHLRLAKAHLKKQSYGKAFKEFLRTLSYDPKNHLALTMVKHDLNARSVTDYRVRRGDTLRQIAEAEYSDPGMTFLVRYYNDIKDPRQLKVGTVLKLPIMAAVIPPGQRAKRRVAAAKTPRPIEKPAETPAKKPTTPRAPAKEKKAVASAAPPAQALASVAPEAEMGAEAAGAIIVRQEVVQGGGGLDTSAARSRFNDAQRLFEERNFQEAAQAAEEVLEEDPANGNARALKDAAYYAHGNKLRDEEQYVAAMQVLSRVEPNYKDVGKILTFLRGQLEDQQAEVHYIAGVTFYLEEDLDNAIKEWEQVLKLDPNHPQAGKDLENSRALLAKLAQLQ